MTTKTAAKKKPAETAAAPDPVVIAYKAFSPDLTCRGFQYEVGKTYEHEGRVSICDAGFHACENPFDVFNYYPFGSRLCAVEMSGMISRSDGADSDSKLAAAKITITAELTFTDLIPRAVAWIIAKAKGNVGTGDRGHAAATGYRGHAAATGYRGHAAATGYRGHAAATGDSGHAAATGDIGHAAATGDIGHAAATGDSGHAAATGYIGHAAATGYGGHAAATGDRGHAAATGYRGHAAATGDSGHAAATGDIGHAAATGYRGHAAVKGHAAVAAALGVEGTARAEVGGAISLAAHIWNDKTGKFDLAAVRSTLVGQNGVEAGKAYRLTPGGEFEEVTD